MENKGFEGRGAWARIRKVKACLKNNYPLYLAKVLPQGDIKVKSWETVVGSFRFAHAGASLHTLAQVSRLVSIVANSRLSICFLQKHGNKMLPQL
ncbi:hypothetical protein [Microscilla marina]|uniref:hypothetical protein n=1 Tax=Microscilla marina TaxID=1027 RepID=UPI0005D46CD7|nr:hypothetical protein [Microscilla marina]